MHTNASSTSGTVKMPLEFRRNTFKMAGMWPCSPGEGSEMLYCPNGFFDLLATGGEYETIFVDFLANRSIDEAIYTIARALYDRYGHLELGFSVSLKSFFPLLGLH